MSTKCNNVIHVFVIHLHVVPFMNKYFVFSLIHIFNCVISVFEEQFYC